LVVSACSSDGPIELPGSGPATTVEGAPEPEPEPAPEPEPEPEPEPAPEPEPEPEPEPGPEEGEETDDGDNTLWIVLLIALAGALLTAVLVAVAGRSRRQGAAAPTGSTPQSELIAGARWVHDQGTMQVLRTTDPDLLLQTWPTIASRMIELEARAEAIGSTTRSEPAAQAYRRVGLSIATLRAALDQDVGLRTDAEQSQRLDLVQASARTVELRRIDLASALQDPALGGA